MVLPLVPLPVVLLPGTRMPLHIFEPRYRAMLRDCLEGDRSFGVVFRSEEDRERDLAGGSVGCRAVIEHVDRLEDGRSNIVVSGTERFTLDRLLGGDTAYARGEVTVIEDDEEPVAQVTALALRLGELFVEAAVAAKALDDDAAPVPALTSNPAHIAFAAAASIELDAEDRQRLLASRSPSGRMREVISILTRSLPTLQDRATVHADAKLNGKGPGRHP
jgi:Lon protease-like protein